MPVIRTVVLVASVVATAAVGMFPLGVALLGVWFMWTVFPLLAVAIGCRVWLMRTMDRERYAEEDRVARMLQESD